MNRVFWYAPDPRAILYPDEFKLSKSLSKTIKSGKFEVKVNSDFLGVITNCSQTKRANQDGTWISEEFIDCYSKLHTYGFAVSIESYHNGLLIGGLYGIKLKGIFFGESMFAHMPDASKVALAYLCENAESFGIKLIDCQQNTKHLLSLGAKEIRRTLFTVMLEAEFSKELGF
jgi:leucyl/phenylalanyl-tRNA--protein transferase